MPKSLQGYDRLDAERLLETIHKIQLKIADAFPDAGLLRLSTRLELVARDVARGAHHVQQPYWGTRLVIAATMVASAVTAAYFLGFTHIDMSENPDAIDAIQGLEALFNAVFLLLAGIVFIMSVEQRRKRGRALEDLHRVRSLTHVIDMHQLSKDPIGVGAPGARFRETQELITYLTFCTDLLSLTGKIGALYAQDMDDPVVIETVNDIEALSTNLSRKIWQKVLIAQGGARTPVPLDL